MLSVSKNGLVYMRSEKLGTTHAFTTRFGGVSSGIYSSLNLGTRLGDEPLCVSKNYGILCSALGLETGRIVFSRQVHGCEIRHASFADCPESLFSPLPYEADALVTAEKGLALMVFTADCIPILLCDKASGVIAAVHAGWRGSVLDIAGKTVFDMCQSFGCLPQNICAAIGPGIGSCCFETDSDVPDAVREAVGNDLFITPAALGKYYVDLKGLNRFLLLRAGLLPENIDVSDECTVCRCDKYWSHRATHGRRGVQAAIISL